MVALVHNQTPHTNMQNNFSDWNTQILNTGSFSSIIIQWKIVNKKNITKQSQKYGKECLNIEGNEHDQ